jgi:hypothetical protein
VSDLSIHEIQFRCPVVLVDRATEHIPPLNRQAGLIVLAGRSLLADWWACAEVRSNRE